jgi:hypothetical protein
LQNPSDVFEKFKALLSDLESLYTAMDRAYDSVAAEYGFQCSGCEDNCCFTRFFHHTRIEYLYLMKGFSRLDTVKQDDIRKKAIGVNEKVRHAEEREETPWVMCPLNFDGQCILYAHRPMICRLHGIPHVLNHPSGNNLTGPGCGEFERLCGDAEYIRFNRTPYYRKMAGLERRLREKTGEAPKFKHTVAQMLVLDEEISI